MITCPRCGASHYGENYSSCTALYYPPVWKDGVNVNPDMNVTTTKAHCYECNYDFIIKHQNGKVWTEEDKYNPPDPPIDVNITSMPSTYTPIKNTTAVATIDLKTGVPVRTHYSWETDIEELREEVLKLKKQVAELAGEVYANSLR